VAYTFDNLFAADPSNPTNVASNASILLYDPNDASKAPVTLTDPTGSPIPNPVTVNKNGFGPAMQHATLDRLAWEGGGFSNFITSYEGIKNEAVSARTAAQEAAATAGADAVVRLDELIAAGEFEGPAGPLTNLTIGTVEATPGNPLTDEIIASEITSGTATTAALSATIATAITPKLDKTEAATTYASKVGVDEQTLAARRPRFVRPQETVLSNFGAGHGWAATSAGNGGQTGTINLNDTADRGRADQVITLTSDGVGGKAQIERTVAVPFDPTGKTIVLLVKVSDMSKINLCNVTLGTSAGFSNSTNYNPLPTSGSPVDSGEWVELAFGQTSTVGTGVGTTANYMRFSVTDRSTGPVTVNLGGLSYYTPEKFTGGLVTICLDDTYTSHFTTCRTILNKYRYKPTVFPIISSVTPTMENLILRAYNEDGWDIGGHAMSSTVHNTTYPALTITDVEADLQGNKQWLVDRGIRSESFAYPGGASNTEVRALAGKYFQYGRSTFGNLEAVPPSRPLAMRSISVLNTTTLATVKTRVDEAKARGQWLVLTFHNIVTASPTTYEWTAADFEALIDYINAQGVPVRSMADAGAALV
jgi:peptidoglycan/xylan/chitin deacetylase (PgdA/CDA1 family)